MYSSSNLLVVATALLSTSTLVAGRPASNDIHENLLTDQSYNFEAQERLQVPITPQDHSQNYKFDALLHLPGISPYFDAVGFGLDHKAPEGCNITAASYLIRHSAIYANDKEYEEFIKPFLNRLEGSRNPDSWKGPLSFLNEWHSPILEDHLEDITPSGKEDAVRVGKHLLERYSHLVKSVKKMLSDNKARTYDTAMALVKAFPNETEIEVVQISKKGKNDSVDALIPHKGCPKFSKEPGEKEMMEFVSHYAPDVSKRLSPYTPFKLNNTDIIAMQMLCGYESAITGVRSRFCPVFTDAEWMAYEYAFDMKYAYMVGPMNPLSPYLGFPWLALQSSLFHQILTTNGTHDHNGWPTKQRLFLSFTHREVPPFVATALGLFNSSSSQKEEFPTNRINWTRAWRMSDLIPFLGHVGMELLTCKRPGIGDKHNKNDGFLDLGGAPFIRFIANTAPRPIPTCQSGPGASCPMKEFQKLMDYGLEVFGDIRGVCAVDDDSK